MTPLNKMSAGLCGLLLLAGCSDAADKRLATAVGEYTKQSAPQYEHAFVDLNNDGVDDAVVLLRGLEWCGSGGCTLLVLQGDSENYKVISKSTVTREPIRVAESASAGWQDLIVHSAGADRFMIFDGSHYPTNPSMVSSASEKQLASATTLLK